MTAAEMSARACSRASVLILVIAVSAATAQQFQATPAGTHGRTRVAQSGNNRTVYAEDLLATFTGVVKTNQGKTLRIEDDDRKILEFHSTHKTEYFDGQQKIKL